MDTEITKMLGRTCLCFESIEIASKARYTLPVFTGREHGCQKKTTVLTGRVGHQCNTGVNTGRVHGCP